MNAKSNYFLLAGLFLLFFLILQLTDIYGNSAWFKAFLLILIISLFTGGISKSNKPKS